MKIGQPADKAPISGGTNGAAAPAANGNTNAKSVGAVRGTPNAPIKAGPVTQPISLAPESSAKVALSNAASSLMSTQKKSADSEFDAEKVAAVSAAITDGTYKINAEKIADKLIANAQEVLGKVAK